ncbi:MAG TPA: peptidylprolyl isomerase [Hyphomonadaceae bacterium]|nr:peptidylprolyl isomerase [Hyphomonadaceae bacterium]
MTVRNRLTGVAVAGLLAVGLAGCGGPASELAAAATADPSAVAALVNGQPIYVSDVELEGRVKGVIEGDERLEVDSAEFDDILNELIDVKLLAMEAVSRGLDEEPESRHRLDTARDNILGNILVDRVVEERVDEAAIKKMYDAQIAIWELGDEAHVRHIVVPTREEIDKVITELKGGADFAILASKKSSDDATRMEGGDLGYMTEEEATPEFAKMIRETPTGAISRPFQTDMGWHVAKIDDRRKEQPPSLEELRQPILKHITLMQIGDVLKELRQEAKIEKQTTPRNSTLDVDTFELPPEPARRPIPAAPAPDEAAKPAASPSESAPATRPGSASPAASPPPAKPPAAPPSGAAQKPASAAPAASSNSAATRPATTAPVATPKPAPAASPPAPQPSGPVSESREGGAN